MLQRSLSQVTNHCWPWNEEGEEVDYKIVEKRRKDRDAPRSKAEKKKKVSLVKLKRTQKTRGEGLARVAYNAKSVEKFGGIVEYIESHFALFAFKKYFYMRKTVRNDFTCY